jgi:asparagine synthase (glutamine-hydrolysing)
MQNEYLSKVIDLTRQDRNVIHNMTNSEARELLRTGDADAVRNIDGQFALVTVDDKTVRLARSIGRPLRYFIAKRADGPNLIVAERIDEIQGYLQTEGLDDQYHPSYTRMAPAHYITTIQLLGCPDPNPEYERFFTPSRNALPKDDIPALGTGYMKALYEEIRKWLQNRAQSGPVGVTFSAGIDSGSVFLLAYHALLELGESPSRLKAFTLNVDGSGEDVQQARRFLEAVGLGLFLEEIDVSSADLDWPKAVRMVEDYKPLDIQAATMNIALLEGIRARYPEWKYILDGDGGDENMKDYPIEENPELTIRSVLNNLMLYQEGWGVDSMKHSITYSGGLSRSHLRTSAPATLLGFESFSPYTLPNVIEVAEGIPFIALTDWDHDKLYALKGTIVAAGVKAVTGIEMPVFPKRRFQHGAIAHSQFASLFPDKDIVYRKAFQQMYDPVA